MDIKKQHIDILHLSDIQFGINHRFGVEFEPTELSMENPDNLLTRLIDDLQMLKREYTLKPDMVIITGDHTEWGMKDEFDQVLEFLEGLTGHLKLTRDRVAIVPGNHDINRPLCEAYFKRCEGYGKKPCIPFSEKWELFEKFFNRFYQDQPDIQFTREQPWTLYKIPELRTVIAGINSTMKETHRKKDHYGWAGEKQWRWLKEKLDAFRKTGWLRIGAVHHNIQRGAKDDDENLRDADDLKNYLEDSLNLILH